MRAPLGRVRVRVEHGVVHLTAHERAVADWKLRLRALHACPAGRASVGCLAVRSLDRSWYRLIVTMGALSAGKVPRVRAQL